MTLPCLLRTKTAALTFETFFFSVGAVMAHELTHGFDDVGRRYDQNGRLHNWYIYTHVDTHTYINICIYTLTQT